MGHFVDLTLSGISNGMIYAAVALGLVLVWRATRVVNFAQGALAMFTTYIAVTLLDRQIGYWEAFVVALLSGLLAGAIIERLFVRPLYGKSELQPVVVTVGLLILLEAAAGAIWGGTGAGGERGFPPAFSESGLVIAGHKLAFSHFDVFVLASVLVLMLAMLVLFRATDVGLAMRAAAFSPEVARLLGVRVGRLLTAGWALASFAGALAGLLVAPKVFLSPNNMDTVLVFGFAAAVMGGLDSPVGSLVGGLATGLGIAYIGGYLGSSLETVGAAALLVAVLTVRPEGIFARPAARRV
jgi:branched-chain amino acid transport system permease protein